MPALLLAVADRERDVVHRCGAHLAGLLGGLVVDDEAVTALAARQPAWVASGRHPEHVTEHGCAARGIGAVRAHAVHPTNRDPLIELGGAGDQRLVPAVIDHQCEHQPVRV
jgi:hypothetical protein